jgi:hypothetical protein
VEERQDGHGLLAAVKGGRVLDKEVQGLLHIGRQVSVRQHRAFGTARRTARVLERGYVFGRVYLYLGSRVNVLSQESIEEVVVFIHTLRFAGETDDHHVLQARLR